MRLAAARRVDSPHHSPHRYGRQEACKDSNEVLGRPERMLALEEISTIGQRLGESVSPKGRLRRRWLRRAALAQPQLV